MTGRVQGKVAFITGAARGQGRSHAVRLAAEGADIIAVDICAPIRGVTYAGATPEDLEETRMQVEALGRRIISHIVDVRDLEALRAAVDDGVEQLGRLDIVVANAGITILKPWDQVTPEIFDDTIAINLRGTWNTVMASAHRLIEQQAGSIILISSVAGLKGLPFLSPYVASKHGVTGLARSFAHELAKHYIRVNSIHPAGVDTHMSMHSSETRKEGLVAVQAALAENPRLTGMLTNSLPYDVAQPADISNAVLYLASDESRFVTALAMTVDGGNSQY
jgi:SDR family mycofactocin-dependent oxidoreductase